MRHKAVIIAVAITYLVVSLVPQISLMGLMGKAKGSGGSRPS